MKKLYLIPFLIVVSTLYIDVQSQTIFLQEGFENGGNMPIGWTQFKKTGNATWTSINGGAIPPGSEEGLPPAAHTGNYNAFFYKSSFSTHETFLISPKFSFEFASKPELRFWYSQYQDQLPEVEPENNKFKIYYRSPEAGNVWYLLKELLEPTEGWVYDSLPIHDSIANKKYKEVQLGFLGISSTMGFGSCIDDVMLIETDTVTKYIEKIYASQPNLDIIPSGSENNPILRLRFPVQGNDGVLLLDSLVVTALEKAADVVDVQGVKLFHTLTDYFTSTNQIGTATSFVNGKAVFSNIGYELPYGNSYVWVAFDIPEDTAHVFKDVKVDAKIEANAIKVNDAYFPLAELNPSGFRKIYESIFYDDFELNKNWDLTGEFERDTVKGLGGFYQNPDPGYAISGVNLLGTDINGLGLRHGDYESGLTENAYTATISNFNCSFYKDLNIQFYRWLNVNFGDTAGIDYSLDNGLTWNRAWNSNGLIAEDAWKFNQLALSTLLDRRPSVSLRFSLGPTGESQFLSGWNIDNFALTGSYVNKDIGIANLVSPLSGCEHVGPEELIVTVKNYGFDATPEDLPVKYSTNGGLTWYVDTLHAVIPQNGTIDFTFTQLIDVSSPGNHSIKISTNLASDEDSRNNLLDTTIFVVPTYSIPYTQNFDGNDGYWSATGDSMPFVHGIPSGSVINHAYSGTKCWATNLTGTYSNNEHATLISPCFDFTGIDKPIFECMMWADAEADEDGLALYYSIDGGNTWAIVPKEGSYNWNWYNNTSIGALGHAGWDSLNSGWFKVRQLLPASVANASPVKLKFEFKSNDTINGPGFAIDNIRIYNAPIDAGIVAFVEPATSCYLSDSQQISVTIKNFGVRPIRTTEPIKATLVLNNTVVKTQNFELASNLSVGNSVNVTFNGTYNFFEKGQYNLKAYTQVTGDTAFYTAGVYNDTIMDTVYVQGEPHFDLGADIGTQSPDTVVLDAGMFVDDSTLFNYQWHVLDSTNHTFHVSAYAPEDIEKYFYVTITNKDNGCQANDSIAILKSDSDVGIIAFSGIDSACINTLTVNIQVDIRNFNNIASVPEGDSIAVGYQINNQPIVKEYILLADSLKPLTTLPNYTFINQPNITEPGLYEFKLFTSTRGDLNYNNDTIYTSLRAYPLPTVDIGPDTIYTLEADTLLFDAGMHRNYYKWLEQVPGASQTFDVTLKQNTKYYVEVQDTNSCGIASDTVQIIADNWELLAITNPVTQCEPSPSEQLMVELKNSSPNTYNAGFSIPSTVTFNGTSQQLNIVLPEVVSPDESIIYTYTPVYNLSAIGDYNFNVVLNPELDNATEDNSISEEVFIWGVKQIDLGPDTIFTQRADTILLSSESEFDTYLWQDDSELSTFLITDRASSRYWVSVTDFHGCPSSVDTVQIIAMDLAIDELVSPEPKCDVTALNTIIFTLKNTGPDVVYLGEEFEIGYILNDDVPITQNYTLPFDLFPEETRSITLSEDFGFIPDSIYNFTLFINWEKDHYKDNDSLKSLVYQLNHPTVDLGDDIYTTKADTVVLNAPKGYTTYYWQDGSRKDSLSVTKKYTSDYWVQVRNAYGCTDADTLKIITYDVVVADVLGDENDCGTAINRTVQIGVSVNSADTLKAGHEIEVAYLCNGNSGSETFILSENLYKTKTLYHSFSVPLVLTEAGDFNFSASVAMDDEVKTDNNSFSSIIHLGMDSVHLGADIITYNPSVVLDAGAGFTGYTWNDNSNNQTLEVSATGDYSVTTTDSYGCTDTDSIHLLFMMPKYDVVEILGLADSCTRETLNELSFVLKNNGNDIIHADSIINIIYLLDGTNPVEETYTFTGKLEPGDEVEIPFLTPIDLLTPDSYTIEVEVTIGSRTSTLDTLVHTFGLPVIGLAPKYITYEDSLILDAGSGMAGYLWNNAALTQTIEVEQSGNYSVTVTDVNGCSNQKSTQVLFMHPKYDITAIHGLADSCSRSTLTNVSFRLMNNGNDTIYADSIIEIKYQINAENPVVDTYSFVADFEPGDEIIIPFTTAMDLISAGTYQIKVDVTFGTMTSSMDSTIHTYGLPMVDLGADIVTYQNSVTLDAGAGFNSYLWSNDSVTQSIVVIQDGLYSVTVTNLQGCVNTSDVSVLFLRPKYDITTIHGLADSCIRSVFTNVSFRLMNNGNDTIFADSIIEIRYKVNAENPVVDTYAFVTDFEPGDEIIIPFTTAMDLTNVGTYQINVEAIVGAMTSSKDSTVHTFGLPVVDLGADIITYQNSVTLDAGAGFASYLWNNDSVTQTISVTQDGLYSVTVSNVHGCVNSSDVSVLFLKPGYTIMSIKGLNDSCLHRIDEHFSFILRNSGNDTIFADSTITIQYQLNEADLVSEEYTFTQQMNPGDEVEIAFASTLDLSESKLYQLEVFVKLGTYETANDTTLNTWGLPDVDLGEDVESTEDQVTLDAGEGFASYLWSTGETTQTIQVTLAGEYWVKVTSTHGCENTDTIQVSFVAWMVEITDFIKPQFGCIEIHEQEVTIEITNTGTRTVNSGTQLVLSYQVNNFEKVSETIQLASNMNPGKELIYNFARVLTLTESGTYTLTFGVEFEGDKLDEAEFNITVFGAPEFFAGADTIEVTEFPYELDPQVEAESYSWNTGAITETIIVTTNGTYTVTITETNTCVFTDSVYVRNITHVHQSWSDGISVYPNPAEARVYISIPESMQGLTLQVTDLQGKLMYQIETVSHPATLDISKWPQGTYLLQIRKGTEMEIYQVIKK